MATKILCAVAWVLVCLAGPPALAQPSDGQDYLKVAQRWLQQSVAQTQAGSPAKLRMEFSLGAPDSRLRLAPCFRVEPYVPVGARLWGKTRLGLRCTEGASKWNIFVPVTVRAWGAAWVLRRSVAAGAVLGPEDLIQSTVNWAEEASPVVDEAAQWLGHVATRNLLAGQALRQDMLRAAQVFQAGAQVRVFAQGAGFQIAAAAQALSAGVVGQTAKVRVDNGRVMSGVVLDARTVMLDL
jgi:flagella basal body P-ring formation protein FlgA